MITFIANYLVMAGIYAILAMSLNLLLGYTGIFSIAHAAIYGVGAYASALMALQFGFDFWLGLVVALVLGGLISFVVSVPALRTSGDYYIVASFGLQAIIITIFVQWTAVTNGPAGLVDIPRPTLFGFTFDTPINYAILSLIMALFVYLICRRILDSSFGRLLNAVRCDEIAVRAMGRSPVFLKIKIAAVSSALGAVGGSLFAHYVTYINPSSFTLEESILIMSMVIIGGTRRIAGPALGAFVLLAIPEVMRFLAIPDSVAAPMRQGIYGFLLILFMFVRPDGLLRREGSRI